MWLKCVLKSMLTLSLLFDGLWFRHSETLHGLIFLLCLVILRLLGLAVRVHQHAAVKGVAVPPGILAGPRHPVHCGREVKRLAVTHFNQCLLVFPY